MDLYCWCSFMVPKQYFSWSTILHLVFLKNLVTFWNRNGTTKVHKLKYTSILVAAPGPLNYTRAKFFPEYVITAMHCALFTSLHYCHDWFVVSKKGEIVTWCIYITKKLPLLWKMIWKVQYRQKSTNYFIQKDQRDIVFVVGWLGFL